MTVKINSGNQNKKRRINLSKTEKAAEAALKALGRDNIELNIMFLSNQKIRALNRAYLHTDKATDVIAFPPGDGTGKGKRKGEKGRFFLGDIAISSDKAAGNARAYGMTFMEEIVLYVIHGTLHLMGYRDATEKSRNAMRKKENEVLQKVRRYL